MGSSITLARGFVVFTFFCRWAPAVSPRSDGREAATEGSDDARVGRQHPKHGGVALASIAFRRTIAPHCEDFEIFTSDVDRVVGQLVESFRDDAHDKGAHNSKEGAAPTPSSKEGATTTSKARGTFLTIVRQAKNGGAKKGGAAASAEGGGRTTIHQLERWAKSSTPPAGAGSGGSDNRLLRLRVMHDPQRHDAGEGLGRVVCKGLRLGPRLWTWNESAKNSSTTSTGVSSSSSLADEDAELKRWWPKVQLEIDTATTHDWTNDGSLAFARYMLERTREELRAAAFSPRSRSTGSPELVERGEGGASSSQSRSPELVEGGDGLDESSAAKDMDDGQGLDESAGGCPEMELVKFPKTGLAPPPPPPLVKANVP